MKKYDALMAEALDILKNDDEIFCDAVDELDSWDGFAEGYRVYSMDDLDELFGEMPLADFLSIVGRDFNINQYWFADTIYGLESLDNKVAYYRDHTDEGEVLDDIIAKYPHLYFHDADFSAILAEIVNYDEDDEADEEATA